LRKCDGAGFVGSYLLGAINEATHSFSLGLLAIAGRLAAGAWLVLFVGDGADRG
jgi:MFS-type transporter involved in bile tolerance (Atg22 family)